MACCHTGRWHGGRNTAFSPGPGNETHLYGDIMAKWKVAKVKMSTWVAECKAINEECKAQRAKHKNGHAWGSLNGCPIKESVARWVVGGKMGAQTP